MFGYFVILDKILCQLREESAQLRKVNHRLDLVLSVLDPKAVGFRMELTQGDKMATAAVDFTIFENGQATATLTPVDKNGNPTSMPPGASIPTWVSSDPSIIVSASADGLSALLTAGTVAVDNATITATATLPDGTTTLTGVSDPVDVVPQPPGSAVAFKIALSA